MTNLKTENGCLVGPQPIPTRSSTTGVDSRQWNVRMEGNEGTQVDKNKMVNKKIG